MAVNVGKKSVVLNISDVPVLCLVPQSLTLHVTPMRIITAYFMKLTALERNWFCEHGNESSADFKNREFLG